MQRRVAPHVTLESESASDEGVSEVPGTTRTSSPISGDIRSREDVIKVLNKICDFYAKAEPSSPVPLVLKRAARLVDMDCADHERHVTRRHLQVRMITGEAEEE